MTKCKTCTKETKNIKYCSLKCLNIGQKNQHHSPKTEFKKGRKPWNYKGITLGYLGRYLFRLKGKTYYRYRYIIEQIIGRKLATNEHVHHLDDDKQNDKINNFFILTNSKHKKIHYYAYQYLVKMGLIKTYLKWLKKEYGKFWKTIPELIKETKNET